MKSKGFGWIDGLSLAFNRLFSLFCVRAKLMNLFVHFEIDDAYPLDEEQHGMTEEGEEQNSVGLSLKGRT